MSKKYRLVKGFDGLYSIQSKTLFGWDHVIGSYSGDPKKAEAMFRAFCDGTGVQLGGDIGEVVAERVCR